jgi:class 3 adenylate cyclase/tetratricopeptide (TPR) repeat protein
VDDSFIQYIPQDRCYALLADTGIPSCAYGAVLFADISGFVPLTEALVAQLGPQRGAEELTDRINRVFTALIDVVEHYGGSVISFSGDAITCWLAGDDGLRAAACALEMQRAVLSVASVLTPQGITVVLAIKVAVAAGEVRRFVVGDPQFQLIDVLAGATLERLSDAERLAMRGEVVLEAATAARLSDQIAIAEWRAGAQGETRVAVVSGLLVAVPPARMPRLPAGPHQAAMLRPWVPSAVARRLQPGGAPLMAELRPASALFLSFDGIDYDHDAAAGEQLDAYIRDIQATIARYEGLLLQFTIGDKGSYLYAAFGAPVAHDDDAARAVMCAIDLQARSAQVSYVHSVRIGIAHGEMYCGAYGSPMRRTYGVLGDKTNLAARLMQAAEPGAIACDDLIAARAGRRWSFDELPPVRVKGKAGLIRVYRPAGASAASRTRQIAEQQSNTIVGRTAEVARLESALDALRSGESRIVLIEGEAGIGKSRLIAELGRLLRASGWIGLLGEGQSIEQQTPYRAWRDIFSSFFELDAVADLAERRAHVQQLVQDIAPELVQRLALLNDLLNLGFPESPLTAALDPALRQESLTGLLITLLHAWARERPLVLVLEDAHWLDSLSWDLAVQVSRALLASGPRPGGQLAILLVVASRPIDEPGPARQALQALRSMQACMVLALSALSADEVVALAAARLGLAPDGLPEAVAQLARQRAGGNPFFAEELIIALRDRGLIAIEPAAGPAGSLRCVATEAFSQASTVLPDTLQGFILARIDRLPPSLQLLLKVAAVVGYSFSEPPLRAAIAHYEQSPAAGLRAQLEDLARRELTRLDALEPELTYIFKHIITQQVAYQSLLFSQRTQIHRTVAEWYEQTYAADQDISLAEDRPDGALAAYYPLLVYHYHYAEDVERERLYARLAGRRAAAQFANPEAVAYLSQALSLTLPDERAERYDLLLARERVYDLQGDRPAQARDLAALAALAEALADDRRRAEVTLRQAHNRLMTGDFPAAIEHAQNAASLAHVAGDLAREAAAYLEWGWALMRQAADYAAARDRLQRALDLGHAANLPQVESTGLRVLGLIALDEGDFAAAWDTTEQALQIARRSGDRPNETKAIGNLGFIARERGAYAEARIYSEQCVRLTRELGDRRTEIIAWIGLCLDSGVTGDYDNAMHAIEQAQQIIRAIGDRQYEGWALHCLALILHELGDEPAAWGANARAIQILRELRDESQLARALVVAGHVARALGDLDGAAEAYAEGIKLRRSLGVSNREAEPLAGLARVALGRGDRAAALAHIEAVLDHLEQGHIDGPYDPFYVELTCYQVLHELGDARALAVLERAHARLLRHADNLRDPGLQRTFLENVSSNRQLISAWNQVADTSTIQPHRPT